MKSTLGRWFLKGLSSPVAMSVVHRLMANDVFCLMLHRIGERDPLRLSPNEDMKVSPQYLDRFFSEAKRRGFAFLSLPQLHSALAEERALPSRSLVVTLDDGYRDNLTEGLSVFERHDVPFTVYLSTAFIDGDHIPWWYALEGLLSARRSILWRGNAISLESPAEKNDAFMRGRAAALQSSLGAETYIGEICAENGYEIEKLKELFLTWNDVRELHLHPLAGLGNHGHRHLNLQTVPREGIREEFALAGEKIARHTGCTPVHYAYAYGLFTEEAESVLRSLDAATCVTTSPGRLSAGEHKKLLALPRFMLNEGMSVDALMAQSAYVSLRGFLKR